MPHDRISDLLRTRNPDTASLSVPFLHIHHEQPIRIRSRLVINILKFSVLLNRGEPSHLNLLSASGSPLLCAAQLYCAFFPKKSGCKQKTAFKAASSLVYLLNLYGKLRSALRSSGSDNLSSACCSHPGSEAMNLRSLSGLRLERHFSLMHEPTPPFPRIMFFQDSIRYPIFS